VGRRLILKGGLHAGLTLSFSAALGAQESPAALRPKVGDLLVKVDDKALTPLGAEDIPIASTQVLAWAMDPVDKTLRSGSRLNRLMLLRFDEAGLSASTKSRAAAGVVAYTAICTHTGCDVSDWLPDEGMLYCPCHFSKYDPRDGATVVDGPAPRPLPALPLAVADGKLVVAAPFTARVFFDPA
jgi:rieske iron-sulfur protein